MKKFLAILLLGVTIISLLTGCKEQKQQVEEKALITIENDEKVSIKEAKFYLNALQAQYETQYGTDVLFSEYDDGTVGDHVKEQALETAIEYNLCSYIAKEKNLTIDEEEMTSLKESAKTYYESLDQETIESNNYTLDLIEEIFIDDTYRMKLIEQVGEEAEIDQAKIDAELELMALQNPYYAAIKEYGYEGAATGVRARHILIKTIDETGVPFAEEEKAAAYDKAQEALERAKAGENFEDLVTEYSEDPGSVDKGGEYTFSRGEMVAPFEEAAYSLEPGGISDIVETSYGYHIIKVEEQNIEPTEEAIQARKDFEEQAISYVEQNQKAAAFKEQYAQWREEYKVEVNEEKWETVIAKGQSESNGTEEPTDETTDEEKVEKDTEDSTTKE